MNVHGTGLVDLVAPIGLEARRLGERTCVVIVGMDLRRNEAPTVSEAAGQAAAEGYREFVFDLTYVRRHERVALGWMADLWARLGAGGCDVLVAAREPGLVRDLCELPADDGWTLLPSATKALRALLSKPI